MNILGSKRASDEKIILFCVILKFLSFQGINKLDKELKNQVLENHQDLLSQATWVEKLEIALETMQAHVQVSIRGYYTIRPARLVAKPTYY